MCKVCEERVSELQLCPKFQMQRTVNPVAISTYDFSSKRNHQLLYNLNTVNVKVGSFLLCSWISINPGGSIQLCMPITITHSCIRLHKKSERQKNPLPES